MQKPNAYGSPAVLLVMNVDGITMMSLENAHNVDTIRAPWMTMPASVSFTMRAARSLSCCSTGRERSTCGLTKVCVIVMSFSRANS